MSLLPLGTCVLERAYSDMLHYKVKRSELIPNLRLNDTSFHMPPVKGAAELSRLGDGRTSRLKPTERRCRNPQLS